jgi:transcriptional regulator with XRE-family HTH domain
MSQGQIEKRTGLLRCYISRVENGHTVPSIDTIEKLARALEVPLFHIFFDGEEMPALAHLPGRITEAQAASGRPPEQMRFLRRLAELTRLLTEEDRRLLLLAARRMAANG